MIPHCGCCFVLFFLRLRKLPVFFSTSFPSYCREDAGFSSLQQLDARDGSFGDELLLGGTMNVQREPESGSGAG